MGQLCKDSEIDVGVWILEQVWYVLELIEKHPHGLQIEERASRQVASKVCIGDIEQVGVELRVFGW